jgi:hypothetical protein
MRLTTRLLCLCLLAAAPAITSCDRAAADDSPPAGAITRDRLYGTWRLAESPGGAWRDWYRSSRMTLHPNGRVTNSQRAFLLFSRQSEGTYQFDETTHILSFPSREDTTCSAGFRVVELTDRTLVYHDPDSDSWRVVWRR